MIADSPYDFSGLILKPLAGAIIGVLGAGGMLVVVALSQPLSGLSTANVLSQITLAVLPASLEASCGQCGPVVGLSVHLLLGAVFGLLYAMCQQTAPIRGLVGVGVFYGFVLWVVGSLLIGRLFGEAVRTTLWSWPWLTAHIAYGLCLAAVSIWSLKARSRSPGVVVPID